ncbi:protein sorting system archaetidylserine decarboxylase [Natranaeroarchaeum aerophilus]|uniref:Protein sorting system archaetidylserine decarboxylase n=1 Tax=Natranaeroarchaeum aerophilus TaxID=2917711 RepID=A0AAE3K6N0_9EURY|nr:protein sorting system archaetidylserine decarboxylase [Natranaeroarchaeum aerophilus]MCL9812984.1 protein sorting system archaetidylserine decarboxylase [Natranaeroarchaeum aerophilus]
MQFASGARRYAVPLLVAAIPGILFVPPVGLTLVALAAGVLYFYRDPDRRPYAEGVVSPADGTVSVIREEDGRLRVGVFMNVWDIHVNRAPLGGVVEDVEHVPGAHRPAFSKESDHNERVHLRFEDHTVTLIAGAFARRIHPYPEAGARIERGDRIGHISFGSRADVLLPPEYDRSDLTVERGKTVRAGETVLARE